jgi:histidine kinase/DNA gyrase B/HSP90-like ATPase
MPPIEETPKVGMMGSMTTTRLWEQSLGQPLEQEHEEAWRRKLVTSLESLHDKAALLAAEIARDLPEYTVHDASHADALWRLADDIAGPDVTLTPTEAYVFGGACAIHDLGMASAAYVDGMASLRREPRWSDAVALVLRGMDGRPPTPENIAAPEPDVERAALAHVLRELHAEHAERLASVTWIDPDGGDHKLLEDEALRATYAPIIGKIAHSHWWATSVLPERFPRRLGAPAGAPSSWTVRPLLVACLLRLADASHLDASRAPRFLRAVRRPRGASDAHWSFQGQLSPPYVHEDRFVFTGAPFAIEQAEAWWLCAEALQGVDRELRAVDALLVDIGREQDANGGAPRLAVRGVAGADDLSRLGLYVPTTGWMPLDARVRVSNVVRLVEQLGGRELYGDAPHVPLRELIQNASDAVRARRTIERRPQSWGDIVVRIGTSEHDGVRWLEVEDSGIGMSQAVLTGNLLDFGTSFWESRRVLEELPGLLGAAFEATGRFGIGFFSVFMWSDAVTITSRKHDAAQAETSVLEFFGGVAGRPLLRLADTHERLIEPGTRVRVRFDDETLWHIGMDLEELHVEALAQTLAWIAPALDVNLHAEVDGERRLAVAANDWLELPIDELGERVRSHPIRPGPPPTPEERAAAKAAAREAAANAPEHVADQWSYELVPPTMTDHVRTLALPDGTVVGRALLNPFEYAGGVVTVGGLRTTSVSNMTGILVGRPTTAARHLGIPLVPPAVVAAWATEQARLLAPQLQSQALPDLWDGAIGPAAAVQMYGGDPGPLPIVFARDGLLTREQVRDYAAGLDEVLLLHWAELRNAEHRRGPIALCEGVLATELANTNPLDVPLGYPDAIERLWPSERERLSWREDTLAFTAAEAVAEAWGCAIASLGRQLGMTIEQTIGERDGAEVRLDAIVLSRRAVAQS